ncbi:MAG TPA: ROK family protein, partial [Tepiditoga sp.]|nr:ROK family protein [Tepiditoga sp.]
MKKIVGSRELIRNINEKNIIKEIFEKKETDRTSISKKVSLSGATVTKIVNEMISKDILVEKGETDSTGGRRPILLSLNKNYGEFIAFKIGMGYINNLITDFSGEKLYRETFYFEKITEEIIIKHITESLKNEKIKNPISVGIGISGIVNTKEGCVVNSYILNLNNFYLGKIIKEETGIDTYIFNDVDSFSMTHYWEGNIKKYKNSVVMTLGVGIGGSIFINSEAYNGIGVGEIGHMVIKENGEKCTCGDNGCLEAEATFKNIVEMIKKETESEKLINKYKELKD